MNHRKIFFRFIFMAILIIGVTALMAPLARADVHTVTDCGDSGAPGQLRTLMNMAAGGDTIYIPACTITLTGTTFDEANITGDLDINKSLNIKGAGAGLTVINGGGVDRVFDVKGMYTVDISNLTITGGNGKGNNGGGVYNNYYGTLTLSNVIVSNNTGYQGGGLLSAGALALINTTISNNTAYDGGGIRSDANLTIINSAIINNTASHGVGGGILSSGLMNVSNSTVSGNQAGGSGGGIYVGYPSVGILASVANLNNATITNNVADINNQGFEGGGVYNALSDKTAVNVQNTIIAGNVGPSGSPDCAGIITSQDYSLIQNSAGCTINGTITSNIIGQSPNLSPLQHNGGPNLTHALLPGSPAIDAGNPTECKDSDGNLLTTDQRGAARPFGSRCDIGAYESGAVAPSATPLTTPTQTFTPSQTFTANPTETSTNTFTPSPTSTSNLFYPYILNTDVSQLAYAAIGDFNNDGLQDVATDANNQLHILLQTADHILAPPVSYSANSSLGKIVVGDFNSDGRDDAAVISSSLPIVSVFLQQTDGTLSTPTDYYPSAFNNIAAGDFNSDGRDDIVVSQEAGIGVLLQNTNGTLNDVVSYPLATASSVVAADFNGDGRTDVASGNYNGDAPAFAVFLQNNSGALNAPVFYGVGKSITSILAAGDVTGDRRADIVFQYSDWPNDKLAIFAQTPAGTFQLATVRDGHGAVIKIEDLTGDGRGDLVISDHFSANLFVIPQLANGALGQLQGYPAIYNSDDFAIGDINNDGLKDIVLTNNDGLSIFYHTSSLHTSTPSSTPTLTPSSTLTFTPSHTSTPSNTPTASNTPLPTLTPSITPTATPTENPASFTYVGPVVANANNGALAWGDYDDDNDLDLLITGRRGAGLFTKLYRNDNGAFVDMHAPLTAVYNGSAEWGDYDRDGDLDILLTGDTGSAQISKVYRNDSGSFVEIYTPIIGISHGTAVWGDYDNDGDLDVLVNGVRSSWTQGPAVMKIYRNDEGRFIDINAPLTTASNGAVAWGDYDNDGDLDILLTGLTPTSAISRVYRNDDSTFTDINANLTGVYYGAAAWGDYDNDGDLDIFLNGITLDGVLVAKLYRNDGAGVFADSNALLPALVSGAAVWGDYNNDGNLDLAVSGYDNSGSFSGIYQNNGSGNFTQAAHFSSILANSAAWGDYDQDGDLDLVLGGSHSNGYAATKLYRNDISTTNAPPAAPTDLTASGNGGTSVTLSWAPAADTQSPATTLTYNLRVGTLPDGHDVVSPMSSNTGYRRLVQPGNVGHRTSWTLRGLLPFTTYYWSVQAVDQAYAGSPFTVEGSFTTGVADTPTSTPTSTRTATATNTLAPSSTLTATNTPTLTSSFTPSNTPTSGPSPTRTPTPTFTSTPTETSVTTFPNPSFGSIDWGDYDADGDLDILISGSTSSGLITRIYRNNGGGSFTNINAALTGIQASSNTWGDYDNDGDLDFILSGTDASSTAITKIYRNDGGIFNNAVNLPGMYYSAAAWGDYDNDGDLDIATMGYLSGGVSATKLYRNDGNAVFTDVVTPFIPMASGALAWGDYDNDGDLDFLAQGYNTSSSNRVTKLYRNDQGAFTNVNANFPGHAGGQIAWGDYDQDGDLDLLISGNKEFPYADFPKVYRNDNGTFSDMLTSFSATEGGFAAWGDYDNDGDLDIFLSGNTGTGTTIRKIYLNNGNSTFIDSGESFLGGISNLNDFDNDGDLDLLVGVDADLKLYRNNAVIPNTPPMPPSGLSASGTGPAITLSWNSANDAQTLPSGLSYNLRLGTSPGAANIVGPMANMNNGYRRLVARGPIQGLNWTIKNLPAGTYFWSVQAIDNTFAGSAFSPEQSFTVSNGVTSTNTLTPTLTSTITFTPTRTPTPTHTPTWTNTPTSTTTFTPSVTFTPSATLTATLTPSVTLTPTYGPSPTGTAPPTPALSHPLFEPYTIYSGSTASEYAVGIGDLNNDGRNDVAMSVDNLLYVYLQNAGHTLNSPAIYAAGARPESLAIGDVNGDGRQDVVVANFGDDTISVFRQQANGTLAKQVTYSTADGPDAIVIADVNNDGRGDIAVSHWLAPTLGVFLQNNSGGLGTVLSYDSPMAGYDDIDAGDVNGDGRLDVVKMNGQGYANPNLSVYLQNASGSLEAAISYDLGNINGSGIAIGDVTGDGRADVVMSYGGNSPYAHVIVFAQINGGVLQQSATYSAYDIPQPVEIADVNMDGRQDVLTAHGGWQKLGVFLQQPNGALASYGLYAIPYASHYKPQGLDVGDINSDGLPDVAIADYNYGLVVLYHKPPPPAPTSTPTATPTPAPPAIPALISPPDGALLTEYTTTLDWSDAVAAGYYQVQIATNSTFSNVFGNRIVTSSFFNVVGPLNANAVYYWRVRAFNHIGQFSAWSEIRSFRTPPPPPELNLPGSGSTLLTTRPLFDWKSIDVATSYSIQVSANPNFTSLVLNLNITPSAYLMTADLPKGKTFYWRVRANGPLVANVWSRARHFDTPNPPSVPALLAPVQGAMVANGQPTLDWSDSSPGVDHYEVQLSTDPFFTTMLGRGRGGRTGASQYTVETALATGTYYWRVRAVNAQGHFSNWSSSRSLRVP